MSYQRVQKRYIEKKSGFLLSQFLEKSVQK